MTKLLILSDSHNSRPTVENILAAEADSIDALVFLGDGLRDLEQALTFYPLSAGLCCSRELRISVRWSRWTGLPPLTGWSSSTPTAICTG